MLIDFMGLVETHPEMTEREFSVSDIIPGPIPKPYKERCEWTAKKMMLWSSLSFLAELSFVHVDRTGYVHRYRILPDCIPFLKSRLELSKETT